MNRSVWCGVLFCVTLFACDTGKKLDNEKIAEEMRNRKVLHITPVQITENAFKEGKKVTDWLDKRLITQLVSFPDTKNLNLWAAQCNLASMSADSLTKIYGMGIRRVALHTDAKELSLSKNALQIWDAYRYNEEKKLPMEANVQKDGEVYMLYSRPILATTATCLKCHGVVDKDLAKADFDLLKKKYPNMDSLTNYTLNQPIGIWNIVFSKNKLVQSIDLK